ncbi:TetR/AcrR family transcriptional regulator [Nocardia sp. NBC_01327]|uniref:TetR/AcrR family transcriptional regulator n=1 Tax=Nocardia sp. NBC_01327 TaxID=2903593 RepID=UPI002E0FF8CF|nr:TetR/AcrR family transcriptional regulator [Nocardia sp. NBC_01327]
MVADSRKRILDGALDLLRAEEGGSITLESAARQVGLTKPGLMYHFPTKHALMLAVVDHVAARWERLLRERLGRPPQEVSAHERISVYAQVALEAEFDRSDFAIFADAHYHPALTEAWTRHLTPWVSLPDDLPARERATLLAARLLADGYWISAAAGLLTVDEPDRLALRAVLENLLTPIR